MRRKNIAVSGIVQGVGFRPFVYRLAHRHKLTGHVSNTASGVAIEVQGTALALSAFVRELDSQAPPLARIRDISVEETACVREDGFTIHSSQSWGAANASITPDMAACADCVRELLDPANRRYRYPLINCMHCGPRFTILRKIPYDRVNTSMASFTMCSVCQQEYDDPESRRFHAQPNACWDCGPQLTLLDRKGNFLSGDPVQRTIELLQLGSIVAIKGLGGFHLAVDAMQAAAVETLRRRKHRFAKPLAVMVADVNAARLLGEVSERELNVLQSAEAPIVLLQTKSDSPLPHSIAPCSDEIGVFLPYTPLQHLLFAEGKFSALVMTSANLSDEPICIDNNEAVERLEGIADAFLVHNRDILLRCDDSVVRVGGNRTTMMRRSRGFVPVPIALSRNCPPVLAVGGELKNCVCLLKGREAFPGQHIGDLENLSAYEFFQESIAHLERVLQWKPDRIAHDLHPGYLSTLWALQQNDIPKIAVQHHHAHIASCMAEHNLEGPVIGIALDGTGYGTDGAVWGGEIFAGDLDGFERMAHLAYVSMPGGAQAVREPWRMAVAHIVRAGDDCVARGLPHLGTVPKQQLEIIQRMAVGRIQSPQTSSCGRLFDAVAALIGLRTHAKFEAQAAMELEVCARADDGHEFYSFNVSDGPCMRIDAGPVFVEILEDMERSVGVTAIAARFHRGLIAALSDVAHITAKRTCVRQVCLSGGCFANRLLADGLARNLKKRGLQIFQQEKVPCGDGGLSLGQAVIATNQLVRGR